MSPFFAGLTTGFLLGGICFGIFALVLLAFRRPAPPPTFHHRRFRDPSVEVVPKWQAETVEPSVRYEWINIAGESE